MIKALILDIHGVLVTNFPIKEYEDAVKELLIKKGFDSDSYLRFKNFGTITSAMEYHNLKEEYLKIMDNLPIYSDKDEELIELLKKCPYEMYIVTDSSRKNALETLKAAGIDSLFKNIITGNDVKRGKPETEMYQKILDLNPQLKPKEIVAIGDRITDIIPAYKLGFYALMCDKEMLKWWLNECLKICRKDTSIQIS